MTSDLTIGKPESINFLQPPEYSDWRIELVKGTYCRVLKGGEKCWFHRKMQEWILGVKWIRIQPREASQ